MATGAGGPRGRGRPRTPGAEDKILQAALDEYGEHGWAGFTMDAVARRAGVGKSTVYLRWHDKDALLTEAVTSRGLELTAVDTGTLRGDLLALAGNLLRHFHGSAGWASIRVTFDVASSHEKLGAFSQAVTQVHGSQVQQICRRAKDRGEMAEDVWPGVVTEVIYGAALINSLSERLEGRQDDDEFLDRRASWIVDLVMLEIDAERQK
jgi:AcrR family transcriptional regulator